MADEEEQMEQGAKRKDYGWRIIYGIGLFVLRIPFKEYLWLLVCLSCFYSRFYIASWAGTLKMVVDISLKGRE